MRNVTKKLGATEEAEVQLLEIFEFEKELGKVSLVLHYSEIVRIFDVTVMILNSSSSSS